MHFKKKDEIKEEKYEYDDNSTFYIDELDRELPNLAYRVFPLPASLKMHVWNFGNLSQRDERAYINVMIRTSWIPLIKQYLKNMDWKLQYIFVDLIYHSQIFVRKQLGDNSVCSLRDVRRCSDYFLWFFKQEYLINQEQLEIRITKSIILALAQCYYYRLNEYQRKSYLELMDERFRNSLSGQFDCKLDEVIEEAQWRLVAKLEFGITVCLNRAMRENLFVMLVAMATKIPLIVVGKSGSSKTFAMNLITKNLSSSTKNSKLTNLGFDDYYTVSLRCGKLTKRKSIEQRWNFALNYQRTINENRGRGATNVIVVLDNIELAEESPYRPLKILHTLLEEPEIAFIGLSNHKLDLAKLNRVTLHRVIQPNRNDLVETAKKLIKPTNDISIVDNTKCNITLMDKLEPKIPKIAAIYESIIDGMKNLKENPIGFDFFGHVDFYSAVSYLKFRLQHPRNDDCNTSDSKDLESENELELIESVLRNFGGMTRLQMKQFLFPRIAKNILSKGNISSEIENLIWNKFSSLQLIKDNIGQSRDIAFTTRHMILIVDSPALWRILFDSGVLNSSDSEVLFGSQFIDDNESDIYLHHTINRVQSAMIEGKTLLLLRSDVLYDNLRDLLNQEYSKVGNQTFCRIYFGDKSINCPISPQFRCIVVMSRNDAHHEVADVNYHVSTKLLNRLEKHYLDSWMLERNGIPVHVGCSQSLWTTKYLALRKRIRSVFNDHYAQILQKKAVFVGFSAVYTKISVLTAASKGNSTIPDEMASDQIDEYGGDNINDCMNLLLRCTSLEYLLMDRRHLRCEQFIGYASLLDVLERKGVRVHNKDVDERQQAYDEDYQLLCIITHDVNHPPNDFNYPTLDMVKNGYNSDVLCLT